MDPISLITEATSKLRKESSWTSKWRVQHYEEIANLYVKAGNLFKLKKQWTEAIDAYTKAHDCYIKDNSTYEANKCNIEIAKCSRHTDMNQCKLYTTKVINNFMEKGDFYNVGTYQEKLALLYQEEDSFDKAIAEYETAIEYYDASEMEASSMRCKLQVGDLSSIQGYYDKALTIFKSLAIQCLDGGTLKYLVTRYIFKACIVSILLCDTVSTMRLLEEFINLDYSFVNSPERKLLSKIIEAYREPDVELFTLAVTDFNHFHKLDNWHVTLLLRIKTNILETNDKHSLL